MFYMARPCTSYVCVHVMFLCILYFSTSWSTKKFFTKFCLVRSAVNHVGSNSFKTSEFSSNHRFQNCHQQILVMLLKHSDSFGWKRAMILYMLHEEVAVHLTRFLHHTTRHSNMQTSSATVATPLTANNNNNQNQMDIFPGPPQIWRSMRKLAKIPVLLHFWRFLQTDYWSKQHVLQLSVFHCLDSVCCCRLSCLPNWDQLRHDMMSSQSRAAWCCVISNLSFKIFTRFRDLRWHGDSVVQDPPPDWEMHDEADASLDLCQEWLTKILVLLQF